MIPQERIARYIELLTLCQELQSEKDGVDRPAPLKYDRTKTLDRFAADIEEAITAQAVLGKYGAMITRLNQLGMALKERGEIDPGLGEHYSDAALDHVMRHFGLEDPAEPRSGPSI